MHAQMFRARPVVRHMPWSLLLVAGCATRGEPRDASRGAPAASASVASCPSVAPSASGVRAIPYDLPRAEEFGPPPPPDLPSATTSEPVPAMLVVMITKTGAIFVQGRPLSHADDLIRIAREASARDATTRAIIQADAAVSWGVVIGVIDRLKVGGVPRIAFGVSAQPLPGRH